MAVAVNGRQRSGRCSSTRGISSMRSVGCTSLGTLRGSVSMIGLGPTQRAAFFALRNTVRSLARTCAGDSTTSCSRIRPQRNGRPALLLDDIVYSFDELLHSLERHSEQFARVAPTYAPRLELPGGAAEQVLHLCPALHVALPGLIHLPQHRLQSWRPQLEVRDDSAWLGCFKRLLCAFTNLLQCPPLRVNAGNAAHSCHPPARFVSFRSCLVVLRSLCHAHPPVSRRSHLIPRHGSRSRLDCMQQTGPQVLTSVNRDRREALPRIGSAVYCYRRLSPSASSWLDAYQISSPKLRGVPPRRAGPFIGP